MQQNKFTEEQRQILLSNSNVVKCSLKAITYSKEFKIEAVRQYNEEGKTANQIFREAGFDINTIGKNIPKDQMSAWRQVYKTKGSCGLNKEMRGGGNGRPRIRDLTDKDKIEWLEAEVAYLKAENDFLAKLRAKRAE